MELMYVKYKNNMKSTTIKDGDKIIVSESKVIPLKDTSKDKFYNKKTSYNKIPNKIKINDDKINDEITNFFFNAIHKNYLINRQK